jgi:hypothetical protein
MTGSISMNVIVNLLIVIVLWGETSTTTLFLRESPAHLDSIKWYPSNIQMILRRKKIGLEMVDNRYRTALVDHNRGCISAV